MNDPLAAYRSGSTEPWTADVVAAIAVALNAQTIIETGTFEGHTTVAMAMALSRAGIPATIYTVEVMRERAETARRLFSSDFHPSVHVEVANNDALLALNDFADDCVDLVFLDDDHTAGHVAREIREALRVLRKGGVCLVHDADGPFGIGPVVIAAGGIVLPFVKLHAAGGLGVIVKT